MTVTNEISSAVKSMMLKEPALNSVTRGSTPEVRATVEGVIADIRERGDAAVREYSEKFDNYAPESFLLSHDAARRDHGPLSRSRPSRTSTSCRNRSGVFAQKQRESLTDFEIETLPGVFLGQKHVPVQAAGAYVPGGKYPLLAGAHDDHDRQGRRRRARRRVHPADPGRTPGRHRRRDAPGRRRRDLPARRRPGGRRPGRSAPRRSTRST